MLKLAVGTAARMPLARLTLASTVHRYVPALTPALTACHMPYAKCQRRSLLIKTNDNKWPTCSTSKDVFRPL